MQSLFSYVLASLLFFSPMNVTAYKKENSFVTAELIGQLGNQLFIIAATVSLALDHEVKAIFPDLIEKKENNISLNYKKLFHFLPVRLPKPVRLIYKEPRFSYDPIPYLPNMMLSGYFQSEKYFSHHKKEILELFAPPAEEKDYLSSHYADILSHPMTVSVHVRFYHEDPEGKVYHSCGRDYYEKAMSLFPDDTLFIVFSNQMEKCKSLLSNVSKNLRFIEGEDHFCDLYLMSLCKHNIIANSTFSWWGAYLNLNPNKQVIAPKLWFNPGYISDTKDLLPDGWIQM